MPALTFHPLTAERWSDLEALFGPRGACGGCWCMTWRLKSSEYARTKGDGNRRAFRKIVHKGEEPGILAYEGAVPVGWCAIGPREVYTRLTRSRLLKPVDEQPVWSITCFYVAKTHRNRGLTCRLIDAAVKFARTRGARIVEAYPLEPRLDRVPDVFAFTGLRAAFDAAGFKEVARRSPGRPIMRRAVTSGRS